MPGQIDGQPEGCKPSGKPARAWVSTAHRSRSASAPVAIITAECAPASTPTGPKGRPGGRDGEIAGRSGLAGGGTPATSGRGLRPVLHGCLPGRTRFSHWSALTRTRPPVRGRDYRCGGGSCRLRSARAGTLRRLQLSIRFLTVRQPPGGRPVDVPARTETFSRPDRRGRCRRADPGGDLSLSPVGDGSGPGRRSSAPVAWGGLTEERLSDD